MTSFDLLQAMVRVIGDKAVIHLIWTIAAVFNTYLITKTIQYKIKSSKDDK